MTCEKQFNMQVFGAPCVFIQDTNGDNFLVASGCHYSSDRNEVLAAAYGNARFFLISTSSRTAGARITAPDFIAFAAWCPTNSKYYLGLFGQSFTAYNPASNTFDAVVPLGVDNPDYVLFANGKIYMLDDGARRIWEINPATNVATVVFTGTVGDDYGYQMDYAPSLNAIVGRVVFGGSNIVGYWVFDLGSHTMTTVPVFGPLIGNALGIAWDPTHGSIWFSDVEGANTNFYQFTPPSAIITSITAFAGLGSATYITYDSATNAVYFTAATTQKQNQFKVSDHTLHTLVDASFKYANGDASPQVIVNGIFYVAARANAGVPEGVRSCGVNVFP